MVNSYVLSRNLSISVAYNWDSVCKENVNIKKYRSLLFETICHVYNEIVAVIL